MRRLPALTDLGVGSIGKAAAVVAGLGLCAMVVALARNDAPEATAKGIGSAGCAKLIENSIGELVSDVNGDGSFDLSDAVSILDFLFKGGPPPVPICGGPLPSTGQTKCYDDTSELPECPQPGQPFGGQDGLYKLTCPSEGRFVDNGDGTVTDTCTGLMWAKRLARPSATYDPDVLGDGRVTWANALAYCNDLGNHDDVNVGDPPFDGAGYCDWRLPNVREMQSLIQYGKLVPNDEPLLRNKPALDPVFAIPDLEGINPALPYGECWTSTTTSWAVASAGGVPPGAAWVVGLSYGHSAWIFHRSGVGWEVAGKDHKLWVLPVRSIGPRSDCPR